MYWTISLCTAATIAALFIPLLGMWLVPIAAGAVIAIAVCRNMRSES